MSRGSLSLVFGSDGLIGGELVLQLKDKGCRTLGTVFQRRAGSDEQFLDLAQDISTWRPPHGTTTAYCCAAVTSLQACREDPAGSRQTNVDHTVALAARVVADGGFVVFPSSSLVFDGAGPSCKATDPVRPLTAYGRQKADAERSLLALGSSVAVVRLTKVVGSRTHLLEKWVGALRAGEVIRPFPNMVLAPLPVSFVARALVRVGESRRPGIFQLSPDRDITYAEAAYHVATRVGADASLVQPVKVEESGVQLESNPRHTTLDSERARRELGLVPPGVYEALDFALEALL